MVVVAVVVVVVVVAAVAATTVTVVVVVVSLGFTYEIHSNIVGWIQLILAATAAQQMGY